MALNYIVQTFRYLNLTVLFSCPSFDYIDISVRKLFHAYIETLRIDRTNNLNIVKYKEIQFNPELGKLYMKYPLVRTNNTSSKCRRFKISLASVKLRHAYDRAQKEYKDKLKGDIQKQLNAGSKTEEKKVEGQSSKKSKEEIVEDMLAKKEPGTTISDIAIEYGIPQQAARLIRSMYFKSRKEQAACVL